MWMGWMWMGWMDVAESIGALDGAPSGEGESQ
jgi:hypothetical protein